MARSCRPGRLARWGGLLVLALLAGAGPAEAKPPVVVTTIQPLAALVAAVMQGAGSPIALIAPDQPPAAFAFHDKDLDTLRQADVFFWVGPSVESGLAQPLADIEVGARMVQLTDTAGLLIYPPRHGGEWEADPAALATNNRAPGEAGGGSASDGHIWLDADNVKLLIGRIAMTLTDADFGNAEVYRVNAARLRKRVDALDKEIAGRLAQLKTVPFLVLHDDYQYLEARYGLDAQGSIAIAATPLDNAAMAEVAAKIAEVKAECVIGESAADEPALAAIAGAAKVRARRVDIYTATAKNPADAFFAMLERVADGFVQCLGGAAASQAP